MKRGRILFGLGMFLILAVTAFGAVPPLINFQGVLRDGSGNPVANGPHSVTFTIWAVPAGGSPLWAETTSVTTTSGLFAVLLGSTNPVPDSAFKGADRYLGIAVSPDPELSPRQRLASVGYSYRVGSIDGALGGTINGAIDAPGMSSKIRFHYNDVSEFPSASTYHGMFAHAHNQGAAYYAHAAQWVRLADSAHSHSSLAASDLSPNPALSVDTAGNVGIGTTNPTNKLSVNGTANFANVGIGTSTPSYPFHVRRVNSFNFAAGIENLEPQGGVLEVRTNGSNLFSALNINRQGVVPMFVVRNDGNVGIGTDNPGASNLLELSSTTQGFVLPRMTKAQRDAISFPVAGMMIYQTDNMPGLRVYNGTNWMRFTETAD